MKKKSNVIKSNLFLNYLILNRKFKTSETLFQAAYK